MHRRAGARARAAKSVDWLTDNVQGDGSLASENTSVATPLQVREETAVTLATLATASLGWCSAVAANWDDNNAYIARRIIATGAGGPVATQDFAALVASQNADGGWGLGSGSQSDPRDTVFVLLALRAANSGASATVTNALGYLSQAVSSDGGGGINSQSSAYGAGNVLPDNISASATSTLHTDRAVFNPNDRVQILSHARSSSVNPILVNLDLAVTVIDAGNNTLFTQHCGVDQPLPRSSRDFVSPQLLANVAAGVYMVPQDLRDNQNRRSNHVETTYTVGSSSDTGFGLTGTIAALPKIVRPGETLTRNAVTSNRGNGPLNGLPLSMYIADPDLGTVITQVAQTSNPAVGGNVPFNTIWQAQGRVGATYPAILTATIGSGAVSKGVTLAKDTFPLRRADCRRHPSHGGTPQGATITQAYPVALEATVSDTVGQPLAGVTVSFVASATGTSVRFAAGATAVTDARGKAHVSVSVNDISGAVVVSAAAPGVANTATFTLQNLAPVAAPTSASACSIFDRHNRERMVGIAKK